MKYDISIKKKAWRFARRLGLKPSMVVLPITLSFIAALLDGVGLGLLIPLARGVLEQNFSFIREMAVLRWIIPELPSLSRNPNISLFVWLVGIIFAASLLKQVVKYISEVLAGRAVIYTVHHLRQVVFNRLVALDKLYFDEHSLGQTHQLLMDYTRRLAAPLFQVNRLLQKIFSLITYLVILFSISWPLTLFTLIVVPITSLSLRWLLANIRAGSKSLAASLDDLSKQALNILSMIPLVKAYTTEAAERKNFAVLSRRAADIEMSIIKSQHAMPPVQETITLTLVLSVIIATVVLVMRGLITPDPSFLVYFYVLMNAANAFSSYSNFRGSLAEFAGPWEAIQELLHTTDHYQVPNGQREFVRFTTAIMVRHLTFSYGAHRIILDNVSFAIPHGQVTALVGPTGSGKSTLISLLMRLYDCPPGAIIIDGVDIRDYTIASWRRQVALVSQETQLFHDTLHANICYGLAEPVSPERLASVLERARLSEFVNRLPDGLNTLIGDRGVKLSGGEKQRVSIARALLKDAPLLILDEATSALDALTERLIQEAIEAAMIGRTSVVIAHRLSTIKNADNIVVMKQGRIQEQGKLDQLLAQKGLFYETWQAQTFF